VAGIKQDAYVSEFCCFKQELTCGLTRNQAARQPVLSVSVQWLS
jgi:hypothetical protein